MDGILNSFFPFSSRELARVEKASAFFAGECNSPDLSASEESLTDEEFDIYYSMTHDDNSVSLEEYSQVSTKPKQPVSIETVLGL